MQLSNILAVTALVAANMATAWPIPRFTARGSPPNEVCPNVTIEVPDFTVNNFAAEAVVLSHRVSFNFDVTCSPDSPRVHCNALGTSLTESLSSIPETWCENNSTGVSWAWSLENDGTGKLSIIRRIADTDTQTITDYANYYVPTSETPVLGKDKLRHQVYTGPANFLIPANRVIAEKIADGKVH